MVDNDDKLNMIWLTTGQIKELILTIGSTKHGEALDRIDRHKLKVIQEYLAEKIDEPDHAWQI